jgi:hypothetical protein
MAKKVKRPLPNWRVVRLKKSPAAEIGTVQAPDATSAIQAAIKKYDIADPYTRTRLAAYRWS